MKRYVVDTHALHYLLHEPKKLGKRARRVCEQAEEGHCRLILPAIVAAEYYWMSVPRGLASEAAEKLAEISEGHTQFDSVDLTMADILALHDLGLVPEMHDRMVVAVARRFQCPVITKDEAIVGAGLVPTLW